MNNRHILFNLKEALEELTNTINEIETSPDYDKGGFWVAMMHIYDHLNTAWNARDVDEERAIACSEEDFINWRQFPEDIDMSA